MRKFTTTDFLYLLGSCLCLLVVDGCSTEEYQAVVGQIEGTVLESQTNSPIRGCQVITEDYGTKHTDDSGRFSFDNLSPGNVKLTYQCNGFESVSRNVNVLAGQKTSANVSLNPLSKESGLRPNQTLLDFGSRVSVLDLILTNNATSTLSYSIKTESKEISADPERGSIVGGRDALIKVSVDRSEVSEGHYERLLTITTAEGSIDIQVVFDKGSIVRPSVETVSLAQSREIPSTVIAEGAVTVIGSSNVTNHGFCYSSTVDPTLDENDGFTYLGSLSSPTDFSGVISNLEFDKEYRVRAYATNNEGTGYGKTMSITLKKKSMSKVMTLSTEVVTETSAVLNGKVTDGSTAEYSELGFRYGTSPDCNFNISDVKIEGNRLFSADISGLSDDTEYYYRAYGLCDGEEKTGEIKTFRTSKTISGTGIICVTSNASDILPTAAKLNGSFESDGKTKIKEWGFYYGMNINPSKRMVGASYSTPKILESQAVSVILTELEENMVYYFTLYVIDENNNVLKGSVASFRTAGNPEITINYLKYRKIETGLSKYHFQFEGKATMNPQGQTVIEAGFLCKPDGYSISYNESSENPNSYSNTYRIVCEMDGNEISTVSSINLTSPSFMYVRAYMIMADGKIIYNGDKIYVSTDTWYPKGTMD